MLPGILLRFIYPVEYLYRGNPEWFLRTEKSQVNLRIEIRNLSLFDISFFNQDTVCVSNWVSLTMTLGYETGISIVVSYWFIKDIDYFEHKATNEQK